MSTPEAPTDPSGRLVLVVARHGATAAAPPGVDADAFAAACLADTYEVAADLAGVGAGICGAAGAELLWPGDVRLPDVATLASLAHALSRLEPQVGSIREVVLLPADLPDLPGLVLAKVFRALLRHPMVVAPERDGAGCAALGLVLPLAEGLGGLPLDLDRRPRPAAQRVFVGAAPAWPRLRSPDATSRLDPGLEGWEQTRALLEGRPIGARGR